MVIQHIISLRLAITVVSVFLLVQPVRVFASGIVVKSTICDANRILYYDLNGYEFYYINEDTVNRIVFCKILRFYHANHCLLKSFYGSSICGLHFSSGKPGKAQWIFGSIDTHLSILIFFLVIIIFFKGVRKLLQKKKREVSVPGGDPSDSVSPRKPKDHYSPVTPKIIIIGAAGAFFLCCALICPCLYRKRKATAHEILPKDPLSVDSVPSFEKHNNFAKASPIRVVVPPSPSRFSMSPKLNRLGSIHLSTSQVTRATQNFSQSLIIGEGGFGTVYKAQLEDGHVVAIKRAKPEHFENLRLEFKSEIELLGKIEHQNLVKLLGYVDRGNERLIITEYVENGTLREHLDGQRGKILDFHQRLAIAIDIVHGLTYLHLYAEKQIIHRDVKSSNILLTRSMRAKVADFGFARVGPMDANKTHISTQVKGTIGYLDPDYMKTFQLTAMSDVFSFGVLLVEILTGRRPIELKKPLEERVTIRWAFDKYTERKVEELLDPLMVEAVDVDILTKMFELAFDCAAPIRSDRPEMKMVGEQLWVIRADYVNSRRQV